MNGKCWWRNVLDPIPISPHFWDLLKIPIPIYIYIYISRYLEIQRLDHRTDLRVHFDILLFAVWKLCKWIWADDSLNDLQGECDTAPGRNATDEIPEPSSRSSRQRHPQDASESPPQLLGLMERYYIWYVYIYTYILYIYIYTHGISLHMDIYI